MKHPTETKSRQVISWSATREEIALIDEITTRFLGMGLKADRVDVMMDITACHCNGTPLNLEKLLAFDDFNFAHDVVGIRTHINRRTGEINDCFLPRSAR
jgi:hypothetical protein